jgi:hypothetical protein
MAFRESSYQSCTEIGSKHRGVVEHAYEKIQTPTAVQSSIKGLMREGPKLLVHSIPEIRNDWTIFCSRGSCERHQIRTYCCFFHVTFKGNV